VLRGQVRIKYYGSAGVVLGHGHGVRLALLHLGRRRKQRTEEIYGSRTTEETFTRGNRELYTPVALAGASCR
jgi:hypothetical protein